MVRTRVLVAYEEDYRAYREAIAAGGRLLRPRAEVRTAATDELGAELERFDPQVFVCGVPGRPDPGDVLAWVELPPGVGRPARVRVGDERREHVGLTLGGFWASSTRQKGSSGRKRSVREAGGPRGLFTRLPRRIILGPSCRPGPVSSSFLMCTRSDLVLCTKEPDNTLRRYYASLRSSPASSGSVLGAVESGMLTKTSGRRVAMDIDVIEKAIKTSLEETLKRTRQADEELKKAQQGGRSVGNPELVGALEKYTRCVDELTYYLKASGRNRETNT